MELIVSNSFREFLDNSDNRVAGFLRRALRYQAWDFNSAKLMVKTDEVNYLTLRNDGTISYLPKGKPHVYTDDGRWARDGRQNGRPATIIKKVLTKKALKLFKDKDFDVFVNSYKAVCDAECKTFVIRDNKDIPNVYCMAREGGGGTLNDSCMNGDSDYLDIYRHCPHVRILTLINKDDELAGRALLWTTEDGVIMDRMYVAKDHYYDMFLEYADVNGFIRKVEYKSYRDKTRFVKNGEIYSKAYKIVTSTVFNYYPYIDTFTYGGDGYLANDCCFDGSTYEYTCTSGGREGDDREWCAYSEEYIHSEDARYIERGRYAGSSIHCDHAVYCETDCNYYYEDDGNIFYHEGRSAYFRCDDDNFVEIDGDMYHKDYDDITYSNFHGDWFLCDDVTFSEHHDDYIKTDEAVQTPDGKIWHKDDIKDC